MATVGRKRASELVVAHSTLWPCLVCAIVHTSEREQRSTVLAGWVVMVVVADLFCN
jgi:hypothetical protein